MNFHSPSYDICSVVCAGPGAKMAGQYVREFNNTRNLFSPCQAYQWLLEDSLADIIIYAHDDLEIHDITWLPRVLDMFKPIFDPGDPREPEQTVVVGLGGATSLGHPNLYRKPYHLPHMARGGYVSNQTDWQTHGGLEEQCRQVAVVDAFFLAVRRSWLVRIGGWPVKHITHHVQDLWLACEAARDHKQTWMVGASCTHHGGRSSTAAEYKQAEWLQGKSLETDHQLPHRWLYEKYADVLPIIL
jgi:hypothetical protein